MITMATAKGLLGGIRGRDGGDGGGVEGGEGGELRTEGLLGGGP